MDCDQCGRTVGVKKVKIEGKHDFVLLCAHCRDDDRYAEVREAKRQRRHYDLVTPSPGNNRIPEHITLNTTARGRVGSKERL